MNKSTQRVLTFRERQLAKGRRRIEFYVTPEEQTQLTARLREMRRTKK